MGNVYLLWGQAHVPRLSAPLSRTDDGVNTGSPRDSSKMRSPPTSQGCRAASRSTEDLQSLPGGQTNPVPCQGNQSRDATSLQICSKAPFLTRFRLHYIENHREADPGVTNHMTISQCLFMNRRALIVLYKYRQTCFFSTDATCILRCGRVDMPTGSRGADLILNKMVDVHGDWMLNNYVITNMGIFHSHIL